MILRLAVNDSCSFFFKFVFLKRWRLSGLEEKDGLLANVEVDESNLIGDIGSELGSDDAVPGGAMFIIESLLDGENDVLLLLVSSHRLLTQRDGVGFESIGHIARLDPALELDRKGDGCRLWCWGRCSLSGWCLSGWSLGRGLGSRCFSRCFVRHGACYK